MSDGTKNWIGCLCPGLGRLWWHGSLGGLAASLAFFAMLDVALVATFGWTDWISVSSKTLLWVCLAMFWCGGAVQGFRLGRRRPHTAPTDETELYGLAQREYLQGNWFLAEEILHRLLRRNSRDIEARLMLATLYRRTQRYEEATAELARLGRLAAAEPWRYEIRREHELIKRHEDEARLTETTTDKTSTNDTRPREAA